MAFDDLDDHLAELFYQDTPWQAGVKHRALTAPAKAEAQRQARAQFLPPVQPRPVGGTLIDGGLRVSSRIKSARWTRVHGKMVRMQGRR